MNSNDMPDHMEHMLERITLEKAVLRQKLAEVSQVLLSVVRGLGTDGVVEVPYVDDRAEIAYEASGGVVTVRELGS